MAWVRLDDQFARHPKVLRAGPLAGWLHVCGLTYCSQYLTDGFIPKAAVNGLADFTEAAEWFGGSSSGPVGLEVVADLVKAGLWSEVDGGYQIHDYLEYNPSRDDVQKKRQADLERKRNAERTDGDSVRNPNGSAADSIPPVPRPRPVPDSLSPVAVAGVNPPLPPRGKRAKPAHEMLTQTERTDLIVKWQDDYGGMADVADEIDAALNHNARFKCKSERLYVDTWLRRGLEMRPALRRNGHAAVIDRPNESALVCPGCGSTTVRHPPGSCPTASQSRPPIVRGEATDA